MRFYIIISILFSLEYAYNNETLVHQIFDGNSDCFTNELYGNFTVAEYTNLIKRRKLVRARMQKPNSAKRRTTNKLSNNASSVSGTIVQRRYGRKSDGSIVVETRVIQKRSRPNATGRVTFGVGFERRARSTPAEPQAKNPDSHTQVVSQPAPGQSREASVPSDPR